MSTLYHKVGRLSRGKSEFYCKTSAPECHIFSFHSIIYYRQAQAQYFRDSGEIADFFLIEIQSQQGAAAGDFCPY
jgi:hypothetical protein